MDQRIAFVLAEIEQRLAEALDVPRLAALVHLSPSRFSHVFRAEMGTSPMRYVRARRMARAGALLESTFLSVKEVMAQVGCNDPSHFARDFHKHNGVPPRDWRARADERRRTDERSEAAERISAGSMKQDPPKDS